MANNGNAGGGFYSQGGQFYYVRGMGRLTTLEDIGNVVLAVHELALEVLVKDVGRVTVESAPRLGVKFRMARTRTMPSRV